MAKKTKATVAANLAANSEGRWISAFENMKDVVMIVDKNLLIQSINRVELGYTKEQVIGVPLMYFIESSKKEFVESRVKELFKTGNSFDIETYIKGPDGKDSWYYGVYSPIFNAKGKVEEFMIITRNITTSKQADKIVLNALIEGQEEERKRVSGELHDGLGQNLSALNLNLMHLEEDLKKLNSAKAEKTFVNIRHLLYKAGSEVKSISHNLAPPMLEKLGLEKALKNFCEDAVFNFNVQVDFASQNLNERLDMELELAVYRIVQELINNSVKYSGAKKINVNIGREDHTLKVLVSDKGKGFDTKKHSNGIGLQNISTRAKLFKGEAFINSKPGKGTEVKVVIPLN